MAIERKIACPFCQARKVKKLLINHIEKHHYDLIPENYSAEQLLYDKTHPNSGRCIVCGNKTKWNEKTAKYHRLCDNPSCRNTLRAKFSKNMIKVYGTDNLLNDEEVQRKMLANRSISGTYKYSTGERFTYTGSYELNAIKFMDEVLHLDAKDIMMPGPTITYYDQYNIKRSWITDIYYIPYNLIIEVKDGGDNPNKRNMDEYRAKQISKEDTLIKLGKYNYLRLVDNNFVQLLEILALLKDQDINEIDMDDITKGKIIRINK